MMKSRCHKIQCILMLLLIKASLCRLMKDTTQIHVERKMVGRNVNFSWLFPFEDNTWKTLFAPNSKSLIRIGQDSAPEYEHPLLYEGRVSLLPDGVIFKNLSKSDEGLYRTEENFNLMNHTILSVFIERELQPHIFIDDMLIASTSTLTKIPQTIRVITQQQLKANITLKFSNGWNALSCVNVYMCVHGVRNLPKPTQDFNVIIHVDYGFYNTQVNLPVHVDASHDVTNSAEFIIIITIVCFILLVPVIVIIERALRRTIKCKKKHPDSSTNTELHFEEFNCTVIESFQLIHTDKNTVEDVVSIEKEEMLQNNKIEDMEDRTTINDDKMPTCKCKQRSASVVSHGSF